MSSHDRPSRAYVAPVLLMLAGALFPLLRVLLDPLGSLPGSAYSDVYKHVWSYGHTLHAVTHLTWPATDMLGAPTGGVLLDVLLGPALVMVPITALLGPVFAANVWIWLSLSAVGLVSYALAREIDLAPAAATAAGLIAQTAPYLMGYPLMSGVHERLAVWLFPLLLLCLLRLGRTGRLRAGLVGALALLWVALGSPVYGLMGAMVMVLGSPLALFPGASRGKLVRLAAAAGLSAGGLLVLLVFVRWLWSQPDILVPPVHLGELSWDGRRPTTPGEMLNPVVAAQVEPWAVDDELYMLTYLGLVPVLGGLAGGLVAWRRRLWPAVLALVISGLFGALAVGPWPIIGGLAIPNPVVWLAQAIVPMWRSLVPVWQHVAVSSILLVLPLAVLIDTIRTARWRWLMAVGLVVAALSERALISPVPLVLPVAPGRVSSVYQEVEDRGGVVDIPRYWAGTAFARGLPYLAQHTHGRPIPLAINHGFATWDDYDPLHRGVAGDWEQVARCLRAGDFQWLVIHGAELPDVPTRERLIAGVERAGASRRATDGSTLLYDLSAVQGTEPLPGCPTLQSFQRRQGGHTPRGAPGHEGRGPPPQDRRGPPPRRIPPKPPR